MEVVTVEAAQALVELDAYIECRFSTGALYDSARPSKAPTGEPYQEITGKGFDSVEACSQAARDAFSKYADGKSGMLYWRVRPEFGTERGRWAFYMRLLISEKPVRTNG